MAQQVGQPFTVFDVRFSTRDRFDVLRIDQQEGTPLLQHVEDRTPEYARTLHSDVRYLVEAQPVPQS
jgi:hypothetical protein